VLCAFRAESVRCRLTVRGMTSRSEHAPLGRRLAHNPELEAEHALVAALVLGHASPADLSGRVTGQDFVDPAAGLIFTTVMNAAGSGRRMDPAALPALLRASGELRGDGYPIRPMLDWLPSVSVPAHPDAWGALVVAGALTRQVEAAGVRLQQASSGYGDLPWGAGWVMAVAAAQRATVHQALIRWESLPGSWRHAVASTLQPVPSGTPVSRAAAPRAPRDVSRTVSRDEQLLEQELLAGLIEAPQLLDRVRWLQPRDFADPACAQLYAIVQRLHLEDRPIDLVTVAASLPPIASGGGELGPRLESPIEPEPAVVTLCRQLQPHRATPAMVPWLARQQLEGWLLREADQTGRDLVTIAGSPVTVGGLGGPALRAAVARLDDFTDEGRRLDYAQRTAPCSDDTPSDRSSVTRLRTHDRDCSLIGAALATPDRDEPDGGHLDRTAG
jgi:hypothetical protein